MAQDLNDKNNISGAQFTQPLEGFDVLSATNITRFRSSDVQPPPGKYIGVDDSLLVQFIHNFGGNPLLVNVRILRPDGTIVSLPSVIAAVTGRTLKTVTLPLVEGWLLSASVMNSSVVPTTAWEYAALAIVRNPGGAGAQYDTICAGYIDQFFGMSYPQSPNQRQTDGLGAIPRYAVGAPAAGVDWSFTMVATARSRIITFSTSLITSAAAGSRFPTLIIDDGSAILAEIPPVAAQIASLTQVYTWADGVTPQGAVNGVVMLPLPSNLHLGANFRMRMVTAGIQAGDQWSQVNILAQEWCDVG